MFPSIYSNSNSKSRKESVHSILISDDPAAAYKYARSIYDFTAMSILGVPTSLKQYEGHVCIIVNVASRCGFQSANYAGLAYLCDRYCQTKGLRILAFPCNQFMKMEPGTPDEICAFVDKKKNLVVDLFDKVEVNGAKAHPLWKYLQLKQGGKSGTLIKWNFTKFIIDKHGQVVARFGPNTNPKDMVNELDKYW